MNVLVINHLIAQPRVIWSEIYGTDHSELCWDHILTEDGGFALIGETVNPNNGETDIALVKTDSQGNEQWSRTFGGNREDRAAAIIQTNDGGYAIAGFTRSFGEGEQDWYIIRTDHLGNEIWIRTFGGEHFDACYSIIELEDGGFSLMGYTWSFGAGEKDFYMIRTDEDGIEIWSQTYGGDDYDFGRAHVRCSDGGYAMTGYVMSIGPAEKNAGLYKTNVDGALEWSRAYGGDGNDDTYAIIQTSDGGYALTGYTMSFGAGEMDGYLIKTDSAGEMQWQKTYGGEESDIFSDLLLLPDGGFVLFGTTYSTDSDYPQGYLVRTDSQGEELWSIVNGGDLSEEGRSIVKLPQGYSCAGGSASYNRGNAEFWMFQTDDDPVIEFELSLSRGWNMISTPVLPPQRSLDYVWANVIERGNLFIFKDQNGRFFIPEHAINNIGAWDVRYGYQVNMNAADRLLLTNQPVDAQTPVPLSEGWSIVSYLPGSPASPLTAFEAIEDVLILAKDGQGRFYLPEYNFSTINHLRRGRGYQVKVSESVELIWNDQANVIAAEYLNSEEEVSLLNRTQHFIAPGNTGSSMNVLVLHESDTTPQELAAFNQRGIIVGSVRLSGTAMSGLVIQGDDLTTASKDGALDGDALSFRLWDGRDDYAVNPVWIEGTEMFYKDTYAVIEINSKQQAPGSFVFDKPYPNPFNNSVGLRYTLPYSDDVTFTVTDLRGRVVRKDVFNNQSVGTHQYSWNSADNTSGMYLLKLETTEHSVVEKLILVK